MRGDGLLKCARHCISRDLVCPIKECSHNIDYYEDNNCVLVAVFKNGRMTLRETAMRLDISFARVKQIETKAVGKIKNTNILSCFEF